MSTENAIFLIVHIDRLKNAPKCVFWLFGRPLNSKISNKYYISQMTQYQPQIHNVLIMHKLIEPELRSLKKKELVSVAEALTSYSSAHLKKDKLLQNVVTMICETFNTGRRSSISQDATTLNLLTRLRMADVGELTSQIIRRGLLRYCDSYRNAPQFLIGPVRKAVGVNVDDIKDTQNCICAGCSMLQTIRCSSCLKQFHKECFKIPPNELFECPFCFIKSMDPLHQVVSIIFMGYLKMTETLHNIKFNLVEQNLTNPKFQIQIRCLRLDGKNNYEMGWPDYGFMRLNDNRILEFKPLVMNSSLRKRKDQAKILDRKLIINGSDNYLQMTTIPPQSKQQMRVSLANYLIGIFVVQLNSPSELFSRTKGNVITPEQSKMLLSGGYLNSNSQIEIDRLSVSMKCVFSMMPIKVPARSRQCTHFNCFDLEFMVLANSKTQHRKWRCPMCKKKAHHLVVDPILLEIITINLPKKLAEVTFFNDGNYLVQEEKEELDDDEMDIEPQRPAKVPATIICIDDDQGTNIIEELSHTLPKEQKHQPQPHLAKLTIEKFSSISTDQSSNPKQAIERSCDEIKSITFLEDSNQCIPLESNKSNEGGTTVVPSLVEIISNSIGEIDPILGQKGMQTRPKPKKLPPPFEIITPPIIQNPPKPVPAPHIIPINSKKYIIERPPTPPVSSAINQYTSYAYRTYYANHSNLFRDSASIFPKQIRPTPEWANQKPAKAQNNCSVIEISDSDEEAPQKMREREQLNKLYLHSVVGSLNKPDMLPLSRYEQKTICQIWEHWKAQSQLTSQ